MQDLIVWLLNAALAFAVAIALMCIPLGLIYLLIS